MDLSSLVRDRYGIEEAFQLTDRPSMALMVAISAHGVGWLYRTICNVVKASTSLHGLTPRVSSYEMAHIS